jgi:dTDP-4-dehydrorhamnose reductase
VRILLLGSTGQLGWELRRSLAPLGPLVALGRGGTGGLSGDVTCAAAMESTIARVEPDVIVNASAFTDVDAAEGDPAGARRVNAEGPSLLAAAAKRRGAWLVHYSTDYVFSGAGDKPWRETDVPEPVNVYGQTKLEGEREIRRTLEQHLILRTGWLFGRRGKNFAQNVLRRVLAGESLSVVDDQYGAPTAAELVADVTAHALRAALADPAKAGLYHVAAAGETSRFEYAAFLAEQVRARQEANAVAASAILQPISSRYWKTSARRPRNCRLDTCSFQQTFGLELPPWQQGVSRFVDEIVVTR